MPIFTLRVFEQVGESRSSDLRLLGTREFAAASMSEGKSWLSDLIGTGRVEPERFYRFDSSQCSTVLREENSLHISFYLFPEGKLCPVRIWRGSERDGRGTETEWSVDFAGLPGWTFIASMEPRWHRLRNVPENCWWVGKSHRDWQKRDCWVLQECTSSRRELAA